MIDSDQLRVDTEKLIVSHEQVKQYCEKITKEILKTKKKFNQIVVITAWWMIPAYYIAKWLWIKKIIALNVNSYEWEKKEEYIDGTDDVIKKINFNNSLIIDDIFDTGGTIQYILDNYIKPEDYYKTVTLFHKKHSIIEPDYCCIKNLPKDEWIIFSHEI